MRFICANRISIFLRSRRDCWKASVLGAEAFHLRALPELCMNLSIHTAPDVRPLP